MSEKNLMSRFSLAIPMLVLCASVNFAQPEKPAADPSSKPPKVRKEPDPYKKWISEDVSIIITPEEIKAYNALQTNEERENFIKTFWDRRDPNPDTEENEFKEEYFERIAYANEHFASGIPGWKTDRGRVYILHGKPDSIDSHPSGGNYDRPSYEGGGSTTTYPFETWFYRHLDNVGDGVEIEFVDRTNSGEYKIARDFNEKNVAGIGTATLDLNNQNYLRAQDAPFEHQKILYDLFNPPRIKFNELQGLIKPNGGDIINEDPIDFDLRVDYFRQSDDRVIAAFTIQTQNKELAFKDEGGLPTAEMNIFAKVTAVAGSRPGIFEDVVTTHAAPQELAALKNRQSIYQKMVSLKPGTYKVDVVVRDVVSGKTGVARKGFTVPRYDSARLSTSTLILASRMYQTTEKDIGGSFIIGNTKVIPNLSGVYHKGDEVGVYMQVYNSGIDQTTLRPSVDVEYVLLKNGKEILKQPENWEGLSDSGQRLTLARLLPTAQMTPGDYELKIRIKDKVSNQALEPSEKFTIVQ